MTAHRLIRTAGVFACVRTFGGAVLAAILIAGATSLGCGHPSRLPTQPTVSTLSVTEVTPPYGATFRVTPLTVRGTGFVPGATVTIDGVPAEGVVVSPQVMSARAPVHAAGTVDVVVTNPGKPDESARLSGGFKYRPLFVTPAAGLAGEEVRIVGFGFPNTPLVRPAPTVTMDGVASPWTGFAGGRCDQVPKAADESCIMAVAPEHGVGPVSLVLTVDDGHGNRESATLTGAFTYLSATVSSGSTVVTAGSPVSVSWTQPPVPDNGNSGIGGVRNVGLFHLGASAPVWTVWTGGFHNYPATGTRTLTAPFEPGQYEFQFYAVFSYPINDKLDQDWSFLIARSDVVTVTPAPTFDAVRPMLWLRPGADPSVDPRPFRQRR